MPDTEYQKILALPDKETFSGLRDYAILRLLWDLALRPSELSNIKVGDVNCRDRSLLIIGKGRQDLEKLTLPQKSAEAIANYQQLRDGKIEQPLFIQLSYKDREKRLTPKAIYRIVCGYALRAGINKIISPHLVRHSSITHAKKQP
ncbi:MAG: tyrosine-type recombinase/integrase [Trichodesmium sp.]